jgi:hypothetical protein
MPADYKIDKSKRMVFSITYGNLTDQDVYAHLEKLRNDPDFDPSFSQLVDCTNVTNIDDLSTEAIYALAEKDPFSIGSRRAFVSPHNPEFNTFRIYELLTTVHSDVVVVFKEMEEAYEFLNLEPEPSNKAK